VKEEENWTRVFKNYFSHLAIIIPTLFNTYLGGRRGTG
jgi:hypothetical protein